MNTTETSKLKQALKYWILGKATTDSEWYDVLRAMVLAEKYHQKTRKNGSPEFSHQLNIVSFLRTLTPLLENPVSVMITAFLHDTYEDYPESEEEIKLQFPDQYNYIIRVSKVRNGNKISYEQYFSEMANCLICSVVKAVDRIHNISTMQGIFSDDKQRAYADVELRDWFLPMLKTARNEFPQQESVYENLKTVLHLQRSMILNNLNSK